MINTFIQKYKTDILFIALITIVFLVIEILFGSYFFNIIIDFGREAYFPELMLKGKLLYKDLFNIFGPLAYQINSFLYGIFGVNLSVLENVGRFCSIIILYCTYFISRYFFTERLSFVITLFALVTCVFSPSVFNFIFPYSYSLLYAYMFFLGAVLSLLLALKKTKNSDLYILLSYFLMGSSLSSKYDFLPFLLLLIAYSLFILKQNPLKIFVNIIALLTVPILCLSVLLFQGVTLQDFISNTHYLKSYLSSESLHFFYSHIVGTLFSFELFNKIKVISSLLTITLIIFTSWAYYALVHSTNKIKYIPETIIFVLGILFTFIIIPDQLYMLVPYLIYILFLYKIIKCLKNKTFDFKNDKFLLLLFISIIAVIKTCFLLDVRIYGSFTLTLPAITIIYFMTNVIPKINTKFEYKFMEKLVSIILIILSIATIQNTYNTLSEKTSILNTNKGIIHSYPEEIKYTRELLKYIDNNISEAQSIMVIPEGVLINYVTGRDIKLCNYQSLMPPYIDTFGIDNVINSIKSSKIDYIIINVRDLREYDGPEKICSSTYSLNQRKEETKLCEFIKHNYELKKNIGKTFSYEIYKLK